MSGLYAVGWLIVDERGHMAVNGFPIFDTYREAREYAEVGERIVRCKVEWNPDAPSPWARFGPRKRVVAASDPVAAHHEGTGTGEQ